MKDEKIIYDLSLAYAVLTEGKKLDSEQFKLLVSSSVYDLLMAAELVAAARLAEEDKEALKIFQENIQKINSIRKERRFEKRVGNTIDAIDKEDLSRKI